MPSLDEIRRAFRQNLTGEPPQGGESAATAELRNLQKKEAKEEKVDVA